MALTYRRQEYNTNVSYMGKIRQHLLCPDLANLKAFSTSSAAHKSLYNFCTDNSAEVTRRRMVRSDMSSQPEASEGSVTFVSMGNIMRCPNQQQLRKEETETEVIPYFFIRALNLGVAPPRRQRTKLVLFTDPWRKDQGEVNI